MTPPRTSTFHAASGRPGTRSWLVAISALLLSGLAIADRTVAWMIGQFPTSAALWELRFEYLRPIGVFHDIAALRLGVVDVGSFNIIAAAVAVLVALGALSEIRLARAIASHVLLAAAMVVLIYSIDPGAAIYAKVGMPSEGYLLIGVLLTAGAGLKCVSVHCEYAGWSPASSLVLRRARTALIRLGSEMRERAAELLDQTLPVATRAQAILVRARRGNSSLH